MAKYTSPKIRTYQLYLSMLEEKHLLIAGATGSGKSVLENALIYTLLGKCPFDQPGNAQMAFIDLKRVELDDYRNLPHCYAYADTLEDAVMLLHDLRDKMDRRFKKMKARGEKLYTGSDFYLFIDEFAELVNITNSKQKKEIISSIQSLAQLGRAARLHIVLCTQSPIAKVLPTEIKVNFDTRVALRCGSDQDSRNIIGVRDANDLPDPKYGRGECIYKHSLYMERTVVPMIPKSQIKEALDEWSHQVYTNHPVHSGVRSVFRGISKLTNFA